MGRSPPAEDTFAAQGVSGELFAPVQDLLDRAIAEGHAADGLSRLADLLRTSPRTAFPA